MINIEQEQGVIDELPISCPACDGNDNIYLGQLGRLGWLRCRGCGWEYHTEVDCLSQS